MIAHKGNSEFCFPETLNEVEGKQNSLFPEGAVIKCFVIPLDSKIEKNSEKNYLLDAIADPSCARKIERLTKTNLCAKPKAWRHKTFIFSLLMI